MNQCEIVIIWVRSRNCSCLVTWFCYQLIAKPGNKTVTVSWPDPYILFWNWTGSYNGKIFLTLTFHFFSAKHMDSHMEVWTNWLPVANDFFKCILVNCFVFDFVSLNFVSKCPIVTKRALDHIMAWGLMATCHYLSECRPRFLTQYSVTIGYTVSRTCSWASVFVGYT